jgi:hypothetical protein
MKTLAGSMGIVTRTSLIKLMNVRRHVEKEARSVPAFFKL